ncbi:cell division cycle protein 23 homolog isoform X1 [Tachysurus ichikawai]
MPARLLREEPDDDKDNAILSVAQASRTESVQSGELLSNLVDGNLEVVSCVAEMKRSWDKPFTHIVPVKGFSSLDVNEMEELGLSISLTIEQPDGTKRLAMEVVQQKPTSSLSGSLGKYVLHILGSCTSYGGMRGGASSMERKLDEAHDLDALCLAKSYFDLKEYDRAAYFLRDCRSQKAYFLYMYSRYLSGEKKKDDETVDSLGETKIFSWFGIIISIYVSLISKCLID